MASEITVSPGHFMLPLPINKDINIDKAAVETKIRDLEHFLQVRRGRSEELAILNLQGLLTLRLHRYEEALGCFHAVLAKDPDNLNALANLQYVLEKLFRLGEAQRFKEQWSGLLYSRASGAVRPDMTQSQNCLKARCLAEQAYAYAFDIHSATVEGMRYEKSNALYEKARQLGEAVDTAEKDDWKLCTAINAHKLLDNLWYGNKLSAVGMYFDIAVNLFYEITQRNPGDPEFQWDSWRHLGDIFRARKIRKLSYEVRPELMEFQDDPEKCMLKAMEVSPNNARLLARYANFLYSLNKEIQKPLEMLEQSINLDSSEFNFYAFTTRATINIKFYTFQFRQSGQDSSKLGLLRNVLQLAKSDLEKAMSMHVTPWDLTQLGEVYYLLAKNHTEQDSEVRSLIEKALLYFTTAANCQDGHKRIEVHLMRGRCLFDIGEKRSAIGCYKQAIDCEPQTSKNTGNFNELLGVYLNILHEKKLMEDESIIAEAAYSLKRAFLKYEESNMRKYCLGKFKSEYAAELQLLANYCGQFKEQFKALESLLASDEPIPPTQPNTTKGGTLHKPWSNTFHLPRARHIIQGDAAVHRSAAAATSDAASTPIGVASSAIAAAQMTQDGAAEAGDETAKGFMTSLTTGVANMDIKELSAVPREQPIRKAPEEARVSNFENDFYVVYPESEKGWVSYDLLNELEAIRNLKGCTRHRNALPGTMKITSEINLMKESASILLVINKDFHQECDHPMQQALRLKKESKCSLVVIPILRDNSQMPDEICIFNAFDATGAVDWNTLARCIEQQI